MDLESILHPLPPLGHPATYGHPTPCKCSRRAGRRLRRTNWGSGRFESACQSSASLKQQIKSKVKLQPDSVREDDDGDSASTSNSDSDPSFLRHLELDSDPEDELEAVRFKEGGRTAEVNEPEGREFGSFLVSPIHPILK